MPSLKPIRLHAFAARIHPTPRSLPQEARRWQFSGFILIKLTAPSSSLSLARGGGPSAVLRRRRMVEGSTARQGPLFVTRAAMRPLRCWPLQVVRPPYRFDRFAAECRVVVLVAALCFAMLDAAFFTAGLPCVPRSLRGVSESSCLIIVRQVLLRMIWR